MADDTMSATDTVLPFVPFSLTLLLGAELFAGAMRPAPMLPAIIEPPIPPTPNEANGGFRPLAVRGLSLSPPTPVLSLPAALLPSCRLVVVDDGTVGTF